MDRIKKAISRFWGPKAEASNENNNIPGPLPSVQPEEASGVARSPWDLPAWQAAFLALFALTVGLIVFLRLFQLDTLQMEIYGDIDIVRSFVEQILAGGWPTNFNLSAGPLYHYLIAPIILLTGLNYSGLKLASVIVSLAVLAATYAFSRKLVNDYFALLVLFIAGVSSWLLLFSRLGNSQIMLPLLTMLALWLALRSVQSGRGRDVAACAFVSGLGLFVYPQSFILPGVIFLTLLCLRWAGHSLPQGWILDFVLVSVLCLIPFIHIVNSDVQNFTSGYIGGKLQPEAGTTVISALATNTTNALLALHVRGDSTARSNPSGVPHLDWISGILFLGGIVFWFSDKERRRWVPLWLVPLILLQLPSILVLNRPEEVPSASRTLGVAPIVYMLVASGLWWLAQFIYARGIRWLAILLTGLVLAGILFLNVQNYFQTYINGLPYNNTPIGRTIAAYANSLPNDTQIYMVSCCWEGGMPENFVSYEMIHPENLHYIEEGSLSCSFMQSFGAPVVFVWSFQEELPAPQLAPCKQWLPAQVYYYQQNPVFSAAALRRDLADLPDSAFQETAEVLEHSVVQLDGQSVDVNYSPIDTGSIENLFDGDWEALIRGQRANPMIVELHFPQPRKINTFDLDLGSMNDFHITLVVTYADGSTDNIDNDYHALPADPHITLSLPQDPQPVASLRLMIQDMDALSNDHDYHIHIREIKIK